MLKEQRRNEISDLLYKYGYVEISNLKAKYNVTEMTIRRDLDYLISHNSNIVRERGGAVLQEESSFENRSSKNINLKNKIAAAASSLIFSGNIIFLDSGTTTRQIIDFLPSHVQNTIITNSIENASALIKKKVKRLILIGGEIDDQTHSTRGIFADEQIKQLQIDAAFLGTNSIDAEGNVYLSNTIEIAFKKAVIASSKNTYIVSDSSKIGQKALHSYLHASKVTGVITDAEIREEVRNSLENHNIHVIIAK